MDVDLLASANAFVVPACVVWCAFAKCATDHFTTRTPFELNKAYCASARGITKEAGGGILTPGWPG